MIVNTIISLQSVVMEISIGLCEEDAFDSETWKAVRPLNLSTATAARELKLFVFNSVSFNLSVRYVGDNAQQSVQM